jgi:hypothetical protein
MPNGNPLAPVAADLLTTLRHLTDLYPEADHAARAAAVDALLSFAHKRKLLTPNAPKLTPKTIAAAADLLETQLMASPAGPADPAAPDATAPQPGDDRRPGDLRYGLPAIQVAPTFSFYSFPAPFERTYNKRTRIAVGLTTVDSDGQCYPTVGLNRHLRHPVAEAERDAARCAPHLLTAPPATLLSSKGCEQALNRLRTDFPAKLPFRDPLHERRFRVWCLMTYLFPLVPSTPFLRVRVPDIRSARSVQHLLEACCWNALGVASRGQKAAISRHRAALAGTVVFSPELRTGRLPATALDLLEEPTRAERFKPPVAYVEVWDDSAPPRVPQEWIVDVELAGQVPPTPLPADHRHLGCAVALFDGASLIRQAPVHEGAAGLSRWLQQLLYGDLLSDAELASAAKAAEQAEAFIVHESELAALAMQVWAECLQESPDEDGDGEGGKDGKGGPPSSPVKRRPRCNPACLRQRILSSVPRARNLLEAEGWDHFFSRKLLEQGVVTYTLKNLNGCLSAKKSPEWQQRKSRGVEVPRGRLPAGLKL